MKSPRSIFQNSDYLVMLALPAIVICFFWNLTSFEFLNFDDPVYITQNPWVLQGLNWKSLHWAFTTTLMGHWHPVTWISHMIDISLFGTDPFGPHLVNLLIHAINTSLVFLLLRRLKFSAKIAVPATLFFALHPMRLESVAWVTERKDVLSFCFGFIALVLFLNKNRPKWIRISFSSLFFLLSLMSKPTFVSLPLLLCLLDGFAWDKVLFFIFSGLSCAQALFSQATAGAAKAAPLAQRFSEALVSYGAYLGKFFFAPETGIFYPREIYAPGLAAGMGAGLLCASVLCFRERKSKPFVWIGWLWFLITALPISGLIPIGGQAFADRWTLLPHIGLLMAAASFLQNARWPHRVCVPAAYGAVIFMAVCTFIQMPYWHDSEALFRQTLRVSPNNFLAHNNLGFALDQKGRLEEAEFNYRESLRENPTYAEANNSVGSIEARKGNLNEAVLLFKRAVRYDPFLFSARYNLGHALIGSGRKEEGLAEWELLLKQDPTYLGLLANINELGRSP